MITRRFFLAALGGGLFGLAGCGRKRAGVAAPAPAIIPVNTIIDPARAAAAPQVTTHPLRFTDVSPAAGLRWTFQNGATGRHLFVESTGGGVAFFDYNGDGLLDIFAVQGGPVPGAAGAEKNFSTRGVLYRNNGDGTFTDVTQQAGLAGNMGYGQGVSVADYDNDGRPDLYITAYGGNHLYHNNGNGTFTDVTQKAGVADTAPVLGVLPWPLTAAWGDYDNDGRLDLFVCHYCRWSRGLDQTCLGLDNKPAYCRPQVYESSHNRLFHNNGDGTFTDVSQRAGIDKLASKGMGAVWLDYDEDGWPDLFVTNDTKPNFLLHNNRDGTFTDKATLAGVAYSDQGQPLSGMGIGTGDYTGDGREDLFVVNFSGEPKSVFHNIGHGVFESTSYQTNIASTNLQFLGFGLECFDYDNDGWPDLIVGNGHVLDRMYASTAGSSYAQSQQLFHNQHDGTFVEDLRSLGDLVQPRVTRGLAVGDYDNDGDVDVLMVSQTGPLQLFRNDGGNRNGWITFRLEGVRGNRDAYGAKVTVTTKAGRRVRWLHGSTSYCSHSDSRLCFGLGDERAIAGGEVVWPRGGHQKFGPLDGGRFYWLREGSPPVPDPRVHKSAP
ncbi:MAG: CRTAC1 family protein [Armatimonadetes bacterium]|nr:CRTAC1 family protein [Armatimonadota bacterium]